MANFSLKQLGTLSFIFKYIKQYKISFILAFIFLFISASLVMTLGSGVRLFIDKGILSGNTEKLFNYLVLFIGLAIGMIVSGFLRYYFINEGGEKVIKSVREDLYNHVIGLSIDKIDLLRNADILARMTADIQVLQHFIRGSISFATRNFFMAIGALCMLIYTSWQLSICFILTIPFIIFVLKFFGRKIKKLSKESQGKIARIVEFTEETIYGMQIVQAFNRQEISKNFFDERNVTSTNFAIHNARIRSTLMSLVSVCVFIAVGLILYIGGSNVMAGKMTAGEFSAFIFYALTMGTSTSMFAESVGNFHNVAGALSRVIELLDLETSIDDCENPESVSDFNDEIAFHDVSFVYPSRPEKTVLNNFNLTVKKGEKIALVGLSGAGKSTVFKLLLRFYDIGCGSITIDGHELNQIKLHDLRELFSYVSQDSQLFSGTVYENILYGKSDATMEEVEEAMRVANVTEFVNHLPDGIHTYIGEKGTTLSGGQKQRIAIARAIIKNPPVVLFDEATSALDTENERMVQAAFDNIIQNHTSIVIAHRLSTIMNADKIAVIENGEVREWGNHQELIAKNGIYTKLVKLQFEQEEF